MDVYRSAHILVREFGEDAPLEAAKQADAMLEVGDVVGSRAWKRIVAATQELLRNAPRKGEPTH